MSRSLSLAAYLALRRGAAATNGPLPPPRPRGPLVWVHSPDPERIGIVAAIATQLATEGDRPGFLVTSSDIPANTPGSPDLILQPAPVDQRGPCRAFLDHWKPDLLLWMQGDLRPVLIAATEAKPLSRLIIDAQAERIGVAKSGWIPGVTRALLDRFELALATDHAAAAQLRRAGMEANRIEVSGALQIGLSVPPCNERERRALAALLGTRPVWLAADVPMAELDAIATAHRQASRRAHRLCLILVPANPADAPAMAAQLRRDGTTVTCRAEGTDPDEATQIYLAENNSELGLWYRLAPITYLAGTLAGQGGRSPLEPAGLGSALLHGPLTAPHTADYQRLSAAGATRSVRSTIDLGNAVEVLLAPDKAAAMAHAAWDVTSSGATVTNRVADLIRDRIDRLGQIS